MDTSFKSYFLEHGSKTQVDKGVYIYQTFGDRLVYMLEDGICALTSITKSGDEKIYLYFKPTRIVGFNPFVLDDAARMVNRPEFSIVTKTPCTLYRMSAGTFQELIRESPDFNISVLHTLSENYMDALVHFHRTMDESAVSRLARLLLDVSNTIDGEFVIPAFFTYAELAKYLGTHTVTVSRIMTQLKKQGYLKKLPKGLVIKNENGLKELTTSDSLFKY